MENNLFGFQNIGGRPVKMSEEEMRGDIEGMFAEAENEEKKVDTERFMAKNKIKQFKVQLLRDIFNSLIEMGVDPTNLDSISRFLQSLERQDPDLLVLFESAINALDPEGKTGLDLPAGASGLRPREAPGLMGKYNNLQQTIMRGGMPGAETEGEGAPPSPPEALPEMLVE